VIDGPRARDEHVAMDIEEEHRWARTPWRPGSRRAYACAIAEVWSGWSGLRQLVAEITDHRDPGLLRALDDLDRELAWYVTGAIDAGFLGPGDAAHLASDDLASVRDVTTTIWDFAGDPAFVSSRRFDGRLVELVAPLDWMAVRTLEEDGRRAAIRAHDRARRSAVEHLVDAGYSGAVAYDVDWPAGTPEERCGTRFWQAHRLRCTTCLPIATPVSA
jgi:hypothetical protein